MAALNLITFADAAGSRAGVLLSGVVALLFAYSGLAAQVMVTPLRWVIVLAPIGVFGIVASTIAGAGLGALADYARLLAVLLGRYPSEIELRPFDPQAQARGIGAYALPAVPAAAGPMPQAEAMAQFRQQQPLPGVPDCHWVWCPPAP